MEEAIIQIGLPVKCAWGDCETTGFVKPGSDHGGWLRRSFIKWYCPDHAKEAKEMYDRIAEKYRTPELVQASDNAEEELYKLLED